ncbi:PIG-L deacetylase family protein [Trujillonella humicola]|uniref:PIG-L deacetylase family protein n=1 Tax=Trujillonella humicola TaxID=3383699 RepID=UPI0039066AC5
MDGDLTVARLGTVLGIWAHPDDEAYLSGALMAEARYGGQRVVVATATAGELGGAGPIAQVRRRELARSLAAVGVTEHSWLGFGDGGCADVDPGLGARLVRTLLEQVRPDTVVTFGPDGLTGHTDHMAVAGWVERAWRADGCRSLLLQTTLTEGFHRRWGRLCERNGVWMPGGVPPAVPESAVDLRVRASGRTAHRKAAALRAHASQTDGLRRAVGEETYAEWWAEETFVRVPVAAEEAA